MINYMEEALAEAKISAQLGEVPIGAVIVRVSDGAIVGRGHNMTETAKDPTAHAEMMAIRQAAETLGGWRLVGCEMYVTCEPCSMCAGAMVWARLERVYIGTMDPKAGAAGSVLNVLQEERLNHHVEIHVGMMQEECSQILKDFFKDLRSGARKSARCLNHIDTLCDGQKNSQNPEENEGI